MSSRLANSLSTHIAALEAAIRELRRSLIDNEAGIVQVDAYTSQAFRQRWAGQYEVDLLLSRNILCLMLTACLRSTVRLYLRPRHLPPNSPLS